jgi:hypothetical protein
MYELVQGLRWWNSSCHGRASAEKSAITIECSFYNKAATAWTRSNLPHLVNETNNGTMSRNISSLDMNMCTSLGPVKWLELTNRTDPSRWRRVTGLSATCKCQPRIPSYTERLWAFALKRSLLSQPNHSQQTLGIDGYAFVSRDG